jgi:glycine cleavage system H protein
VRGRTARHGTADEVADRSKLFAAAVIIFASATSRSARDHAPSRSDFIHFSTEISMATPTDCRVSDTHEWFRVNGTTVTMGITQHAADALTDITYVEMKPVGTAVGAGGSVGEVESVKTTSEIYATAAGKIIEVNAAAVKDPSLLNSDPCGKGWLVKLEVADASAILALPNGADYDKKHGH